MNFETFKDPLIVSIIFFAAASDWLDSYIRDMFPQLKTTNPVVFTIIKTFVFLCLYFLYQKFMSNPNNRNNNTTLTTTTPNSVNLGPLPNNQVINTTTAPPKA